MRTYRIELAEFSVAGENAAGILAQCDAMVGNLPIKGVVLLKGEDGSNKLKCPARVSDDAKAALQAVVTWAWAETSAIGP